ncbi:MAG TPA: response regulator [Solirubrobacterales bacterium]|nr:response regulator [Solirubrobacterales bacterium]
MRSILLLAGDPEDRRALGDHLAGLFPEARVLITESGETAIELARRTWPSVVVLDLAIPGNGVLPFTRSLRALAAGATVPIVALVSASAEQESLLAAETLGFAAFLRKPVDKPLLVFALRPLLDRPPPLS